MHEKKSLFLSVIGHQRSRRTALSIRASRLGVRNTGAASSSRVAASRSFTSDALDKGRHFHNHMLHLECGGVFRVESNERINTAP